MPDGRDTLVPGDDLALAVMRRRHVRPLGGATPQQEERPAAGNGTAAAAAPCRLFDTQRANARERLAQAAVALAHQKRQPEHPPPRLPVGDDLLVFARRV